MTIQQIESITFTPTTGTGLDDLVDIITSDAGLAYRIPAEEIVAGASAADKLNGLIIQSIEETGVGNDGELNMADVRDLNNWIQENSLMRWTRQHGDDEDGEETGFHLVQNDGAISRLYANNAVNTVADGIYHLGFEIDGYRFLNEDGNGNVSVETMAYWLNDLLADDLADGSLVNEAVDPYLINTTTGTGLDRLVDTIVSDQSLNARISTSEITAGANAAADMNELIVKAIKKTGVANDGELNMADVRDMNAWLQENASTRWARFHGDDEDGEETGFHLVQNDGAKSRLFGQNAVDTVADGIYHLGFEIDGYRFLNEDGNGNVSVETMADWLGDLLTDDLADGSLVNEAVDPYLINITTGTGLDSLVDTIVSDQSLNARISTSEITAGANAAADMNKLIVKAIKKTGVANDGELNMADVRDMNAWLQENASNRWTRFHGDDEDGKETGFHLVQNDGAKGRLFGHNAVDTVADGIYHLGFEIDGYRFLNEDGNGNVSVETMAYWLDDLLADDLADGSLANARFDPYLIDTTTGTGLDSLVDMITSDEGLNARISTSEISKGANAAADMNKLIIKSIKQTGVANDGEISSIDMHDMNAWLQENRLTQWTRWHGDDEENGEETGFHLVQNDGASSRLFGHNAVDTVADGLYHIGFDIDGYRFLNEDGNGNVSLETAAHWLNELLEDDLASGSLNSPGGIDVAALSNEAIYRLDAVAVDGPGDQVEVDHDPALALANGTFSFSFVADEPTSSDWETLFSKDASGNGDGGHLSAWVRDGEVKVRLQDDSDEVWLHSGAGTVQAGQEYDVAFSFGEGGAQLYLDGVKVDLEKDFAANLTGNDEGLAIGANTWARSDSDPDWRGDYFHGQIEDFMIFDYALDNAEVYALSASNPDTRGAPSLSSSLFTPTTGTGLDDLVDIITSDAGLAYRIPAEEIVAGASAADKLNGLIIQSIEETGVGNDGELNMADVRDLNNWIQENSLMRWTRQHGDDEDGEETGFHLVQNDGAISRLYANNAVNTVADGIYHLGFEIDGYRFLNEDGNGNVSVETMAYWLNDLLADDLADGSLVNEAVDPYLINTTTGTGLDRLVDTIVSDQSLNARISTSEITAGANAAADMNELIVKAIKKTGVANDGELNMADVRDMNAWLQENASTRWARFHGDDEDGEETGFHLVQNDGAKSRLFGQNAVDTVADGIYHLGFEIDGYRFLNEDGNGNVSVETMADWLGDLLTDDLADGSLVNEAVDPYLINITTGTGLDSLVDTIVSDQSLNARISTSEITAGANAAADMNKLIVKAIKKTGVANDGELNMADVRDMNAWLQENASNRWTRFHGDDEDGKETGFHLVQNDGAKGRLFGHNAVDTVADGIYHLGFEIDGYRFLNEDGNGNVSVETMAYWLDDLLADDLADGSLANARFDPYLIDTTTGTGLDSLVDMITSDEGLNARISTSEISKGANAAADMNKLIIKSIKQTGVANDGEISSIDMHDMNAWLQENRLTQWTRWHGDDEENGEETGFHLVQNDGASSRLFGHNAVDTVADGLYHIGFDIDGYRFLNEDGNGNVSLETAAHWLNELLEDDLASGSLNSPGGIDVAALSNEAIYRLDAVAVDGPGDQVEVDHDPALALANGTFSFSFVADEPTSSDWETLFSKDASGNGDGGHLSAWVRDGEVKVRLQDDSDEVWLHSGAGTVQAGQEYDVAFSFGEGGAQLYLDGVKVDLEKDFAANLTGNDEGLAIGANTWARSDSDPDWRGDYFHGQIEDFMIFDYALDNAEIFALAV